MQQYQEKITDELKIWQKQMVKKPSLFNKLSKKIQTKVNTWIPEKVHRAITATIMQMIKGVLFGAKYTTQKALAESISLEEKEMAVIKRIEFYRTTAAVEGGITGAGGILLGLADFPILLGLKLKLLFDIASIYGQNVMDYKERVYILHIFELAFSSHEHRKNIYLKMVDWHEKSKELPEDINQFDWRNFQQEYRDYIDLAKLAQLVPVIGAPVGAIVNYKLIKKLGVTAMNAYRMRLKEIN
ncbi:MAG: EcsC family protein [Ferruginibacter sp.]|nr:EcsC family protein [Ferruginibacter sp.]